MAVLSRCFREKEKNYFFFFTAFLAAFLAAFLGAAAFLAAFFLATVDPP